MHLTGEIQPVNLNCQRPKAGSDPEGDPSLPPASDFGHYM